MPPRNPYLLDHADFAVRVAKHRARISHGKSLPTYGIEPLYSLFKWANPFPAKDRLKLETTLHLALKAVVPKVTGDANWTAPAGH